LLASAQVGATLIEQDLLLVDDGLITLDSSTGLEWLDVTQTVGMSYTSVLGSQYVSQMSFRYATLQELTALFDNAGGSGDYLIPRSTINSENYNGVPVVENYSAAMSLLNFMGCTSYIVGQACDLDGQDWHIGMYGNQVNSGIQTAAIVDAYNNSPPYGNAGAIWVDFSEFVPSRTTTDFGSYLVRTSSVPEPSVISILLIGILGMAFARRKESSLYR
jgi:hypothetical protein